MLLMSHYSNIMTMIGCSKVAKEMRGRVTEDRSDKVQLRAAGQMMSAVVVTEVDKKHQGK